MHPLTLLRLCVSFGIIVSGGLALAHFLASLPATGGMPIALPLEKTGVKVSDLLSVLITVSGITVPILIAYMLIKDKELQVTISERTWLYLDRNGITMEAFRSACLLYEDPSIPLTSSEMFKSIQEAVDLGRHEADEVITETAQKWLLSTPKLRNTYGKCFSAGQDRSAIGNMIAFVGISAILCFADMYARFYGIVSLSLDEFEFFLVPATGIFNVIAYGMLSWIVFQKSAIRKSAFFETKKLCSQIKPEVEKAISHSAQQGASLKAKLLSGSTVQMPHGPPSNPNP